MIAKGPSMEIGDFDRFDGEISRNRRRAWRQGLLALFFLVVPALAVIYFAGPHNRPFRNIVSAVAEVWTSPDLVFAGRSRINVVFVGIDVNRDRRGMPYTKHSRSDTILVVNFDRFGEKVSAISVPRDTLAAIPGHYSTKINAAHALGGPELLLSTLDESLGIHSDYFIKVKFAGLEKAVDAVGGVDLFVEKDMDYDDNWGQLHIHLKEGFQHLDGAKAHQYARFRHDAMGDIGRVARQQKLMKALAKKMLSPGMIPRIPMFIKVFKENVETNMTTSQLLSLGAFMKSVNPDSIGTMTLPGIPRGGYWVADPSEAPKVLSQLLGTTFSPSLFASRGAISVPSGRHVSQRDAQGEAAAEPPLESTAAVSEEEPVTVIDQGPAHPSLPRPAASSDAATPDTTGSTTPHAPQESGRLSIPRDTSHPPASVRPAPGPNSRETPTGDKPTLSPDAGKQPTIQLPSREGVKPKPEPPSLSPGRELPPAQSKE